MLNILKGYIELIDDSEIKADIKRLICLDEVIEAFKYPSSASGLFHPKDEIVQYGLLLHSIRVCNVAVQLYRNVEDHSVNPQAYDILIASALLHDVPFKNKNGISNKNHAHDNAVWFSQNSQLPNDKKVAIANAIMWHMGRWSNCRDNLDYEIFPNNLINWTLHQADSLASRSNIVVNIDCIEYLKSNL